jgi:putative hemolysin
MFGGTLVEMALIFILILANGVFAAAELAVVSARKGRLEQEAERGRHGARVALQLADDPNHFLSTVQVGITLIGTLAAAFGGARIAEVLAETLRTFPMLAGYADSIALGIVVILISYFSLIIGELVPKRLSLQSAEEIAIRLAPIMRFLGHITSPIVRFLTFSSELVLWLLRRHNVPETPITEDDVLALVREGTAEGTLETTEADLINNVFSFTERSVRTLMTPRTQVVAVDLTTPLPEIIHLMTETEPLYSRLPVYQGTLDTVIGILHVRDLLKAIVQSPPPDLGVILRPPVFIPEAQRAAAALVQFKLQHSRLAIVVDEFGQTAGIITLKDVIDELVGDLGATGQSHDEAIVHREDGSYLVSGLLPFVDVADALNLPSAEAVSAEHDFETVAGFVIALLGRLPQVGDTVQWEHYTFEVVDMDGNRLDKMIVHPPKVTAGAQTEGILANSAVSPAPEMPHASEDEHK